MILNYSNITKLKNFKLCSLMKLNNDTVVFRPTAKKFDTILTTKMIVHTT